MSSRVLIFLIFLVVASMGAVFISVLPPRINTIGDEKFFRLNEIRGLSITHNGKEYTLNFDQQNEVALRLNASIPINAAAAHFKLTPPPFEKICIYIFNAPTIELSPIGFDGDALIFTTPAWNNGKMMRDMSNGSLKTTLLNTYDA